MKIFVLYFAVVSGRMGFCEVVGLFERIFYPYYIGFFYYIAHPMEAHFKIFGEFGAHGCNEDGFGGENSGYKGVTLGGLGWKSLIAVMCICNSCWPPIKMPPVTALVTDDIKFLLCCT